MPAEDDLLPPGMRVIEAIDVSPAARDTEARQIASSTRPGQILVLEVADGGTLVANPGRLKDALDRAGASQSQRDNLPISTSWGRTAAPNAARRRC